MGNDNVDDYSTKKNKILTKAYNKINKVTNYQKLKCKEPVEYESDYYEEQITEINEAYYDIIDAYQKQFIKYKMSLARSDFFDDSHLDSLADDIIDREIVRSDVEENVKYDDVFGQKRNLFSAEATGFTEYESEIIKDNYKKNYNKGEQISIGMWDTGNGGWSTATTSEDIGMINFLEKQLVHVQQSLSIYKTQIEQDIETLQNCILSVDEDIDKIEVKNNKLRKKISSIKGYNVGGEGKLYDSQLLYNQYYLGNWIVGLILFFVIYKIGMHYVNNQQQINTQIKNTTTKISDAVTKDINK